MKHLQLVMFGFSYHKEKKDEYQKIKKNHHLDLDEVLRLKNIMNTKKKYL